MEIVLRFIVTLYLCMSTFAENIPMQFGSYFNRELLASVPNLSLKGCEQECRSRGNSCSGISYRRQTHLCFIHGQEELTMPYDTTSGMLYSNASEWRTPPSNKCGNSTCSLHMKCEEDNCRVIECGQRASLTNAEIKGNMRDVGSTVRHSCKEGFNAIGAVTDFTTVCFPNSSWSPLNLELCSNAHKQHINMKIMQQQYLVTRNITESFTGITLAECLRRCDLTTLYCIGVNYRQETCELASEHMWDITGTTTYINANGWIAVEKLLPVFLTTGPTNSRYTLSFSEAQQACSSLGTRLATYAELTSAYRMGYNRCACGWVQEQISYIVMHYNITECVRGGITACLWQANWDAFCANVH